MEELCALYLQGRPSMGRLSLGVLNPLTVVQLILHVWFAEHASPISAGAVIIGMGRQRTRCRRLENQAAAAPMRGACSCPAAAPWRRP